ncbi:helix-turn-helix transcriptional regulator [Mesorhizobium sp. B2-6-7]|uniref:helix-turn-helix domain-containing protein n=1 Tax=Mesorhizobium sp. B2-6-7 TaxID=2589910 RepID=UPI0015E48B7B|nr:helix-turn-helix transcriptional regulator [Mesorhizobium sp. B2-6-7]
MKLAQYISDHEMTDEAFAVTVGMSQSQISRIKRGISRPSWDSVAAIERATGGQVTASDFAQTADVSAASAPEQAA